ncbi:hypothetical protein K440DRAFT_663773 [Wilcoxina mikolae CBS 423.85]|nr:hypothetical protein K440DRAFT_663773 [Wilcoxina mikolae CBS 423.85]
MGFLCCGKKAPTAPSPTPTPPRITPKLARRRSAPRPRASKKNIEEFYREGQELLRAEQEEQERSQLRAALKLEYERDMVYDDDARYIKEPLAFGIPSVRTEGIEGGPSGTRSAADSVYRTATTSNRNTRYSFETTTDRMGVRAKGMVSSRESERTELLTNLHTPDSNENLQYPYRASHAAESIGPDNGEPATSPIAQISNGKAHQTPSATTAYATDSDSSPKPEQASIGVPNTGSYDEPEEVWPSAIAEPDGEVTPKVSRMLRNNDTSHVGLSRSGTLMRELPKIDTDMIRAAAADQPGIATTRRKNRLEFPSEEIFARIPSLLKASTSTFFGSSSSHVGRRELSSPASDETALHRKFSKQSLRQTRPPSRRTSLGTLFMGPTQQRIDSASSFYPSVEGSQCQSLQQSEVDFSDAVGFPESHASTMPRMYKLRSADRIHRARSSSSFKRAEDSSGFSKFNFPWNGEASPARTLVRVGSVAEIVPEEDIGITKELTTQLEVSPVRTGKKKKVKGSVRPQKRTSSSRALTGMLNFVKSGVTGEEYSSTSSGLQSPEGFDVRSSTANIIGSPARTRKHAGPPSDTVRSKRAIKPQGSWSSQQGSPRVMYPNNKDQVLRRSLSFKEKPSGLRHVATGGTEESLGRFDHLGDSDSTQSRRLTLRKSFTISMAKIREKVSIGGFRTISRAGGADSEKQSVRTRTLDIIDMDDGAKNTEYKPSFSQRKMMTIRSRDDDVSDSTSTGNGRVILRRSNTTQTLPSRRPSAAARSVYNKKRSTAYDDCVIFPFADGGDDGYDEEFTYGRSDGAAFRPRNFQAEEYASEREFWRSRSAVDDLEL